MTTERWANEFSEIVSTVSVRPDIRASMQSATKISVPGKATDGGDRWRKFAGILEDHFCGKISFADSIAKIARDLPRSSSSHRDSNRVFANGWEERLIRTQLSRLYNQSVLEILLQRGDEECFVPHSSAEDVTTRCSSEAAGRNHSTKTMYKNLVDSYIDGNWNDLLKIPHHPHCTHVIHPIL